MMKVRFFAKIFFLLSIICFVSFILVFAIDEGTIRSDKLEWISFNILKIFYFPFIGIYYRLSNAEIGMTFYAIGLIADVVFLTSIFQLILLWIRKTNK